MKNIVLAGVKTVTIQEEVSATPVTQEDIALNFVYKSKDLHRKVILPRMADFIEKVT